MNAPGLPVRRIDAIFARHRAQRRPALMPFITAGHPSLDITEALLPRLADAGASIIEIGFPFSDPIADGPVIAASMHEALQRGVTPLDILEMVQRIRPRVEAGLVAMLSISILERLGPARFIDDAARAGFDGLIVPDVDTVGGSASPAAELAALCDRHDLSFSLLIAPTTRPDRLRELVALCRGFVYILARVGLTGEQAAVPEIAARITELRAFTDLPLAVGFGISRAEHVRAVTREADAAIVGSALVRRLAKASDPVAAGEAFVRELAAGLVEKSTA